MSGRHVAPWLWVCVCMWRGKRGVGGDVWFTFKMSPRSRPVVRSKATLMQQKLPFLKHIYGFPLQIIPDFCVCVCVGMGGSFSAASRRIFTHVAHRISFDRADLAPSGVKVSFFFFLACLFLFCAVTARLHPER